MFYLLKWWFSSSYVSLPEGTLSGKRSLAFRKVGWFYACSAWQDSHAAWVAPHSCMEFPAGSQSHVSSLPMFVGDIPIDAHEIPCSVHGIISNSQVSLSENSRPLHQLLTVIIIIIITTMFIIIIIMWSSSSSPPSSSLLIKHVFRRTQIGWIPLPLGESHKIFCWICVGKYHGMCRKIWRNSHFFIQQKRTKLAENIKFPMKMIFHNWGEQVTTSDIAISHIHSSLDTSRLLMLQSQFLMAYAYAHIMLVKQKRIHHPQFFHFYGRYEASIHMVGLLLLQTNITFIYL